MVKKQTTELVLESIEVILKQAIDDGILKDIPIIGTVFKAMDIGGSIRDKIYGAKVAKFILNLSQVTETDKERFKLVISERKEDIDRLTQKILLSIESQTDIEKSEIIADLFLAYLDEELSDTDFRRAIDVTNSVFLDDLLRFLDCGGFQLNTYEELEWNKISNLVSSPLISIDPTSQSELKKTGCDDLIGVTLYQSTDFANVYRNAVIHGVRLRKHRQQFLKS